MKISILQDFAQTINIPPDEAILVTGGKGNNVQPKQTTTNLKSCKTNSPSCVLDILKCGLTISPDSIKTSTDSIKTSPPHIINTDKCYTNTQCPKRN